MIDLHNHILPGIDDGATGINEALEMARIAVEEGFSAIVATPHFGSGLFSCDANEVRRRVNELNEKIASADLRLTIYPGMEARLTADVLNSLSNGSVISLNDSQYILLELPALQVPAGFENFVRMMINSGRKIVLAHPEKNVEMQTHPDTIYKLVTMFRPGDLLIQITADSISGDAGLRALSTSKWLLENGLAHILATDAHSPIQRAPRIRKAFELVSSLVGREKTVQMTTDWPRNIIENEDVVCSHPRKKPEKRKRFFGLLGK
jgi:protein-tyrosine phosphatase